VKQTLVTEAPEAAAAVLRAGGLVVFPTETVYGLGADATSPSAVAKIFAVKGRPSDNPLIVHVADEDQLASVTQEVTPLAAALLQRFAPGPITVVVRRHPSLAPAVSAGLDTVGVRIPELALARAFLRAAGRPVAAPSANRSGSPSPTRVAHVLDELASEVDAVLLGPDCRIGLESTVVDARGVAPIVLREGGVSLEALRATFPETRLANTDDATEHSPGTRHRHYAPKARVVLVGESSTDPRHDADEPLAGLRRAWIGLAPPPHRGFELVHVAGDVEAYAQVFFDFLRRCDATSIDEIHCEWPAMAGLGGALRDRLSRAARG
jgi:L-threonylcarbamoyladenylate synthase